MATYYDILGINHNAKLGEIKKAFRILAKQYHPDLNSAENAKEKFIEIEVAYSCLSDSKTRLAYDLLIKPQRTNRSKSTRQRKYQQTVYRQSSAQKRQAQTRSRMSYQQYKRDELMRRSIVAATIKVALTIIFGAILMYVLYKVTFHIYGPQTDKWSNYIGTYFLAGIYFLSLIDLYL